MANLGGDERLLSDYWDELFDQFTNVTGDPKADGKVLKSIDQKMPIYLKQAQQVRMAYPDSTVGAFHESNYHVFRAMRLASSSGVARRLANASASFGQGGIGVSKLIASGVAGAQEKANATKALGIIDEAISIRDTAFARFKKSHLLDALGRKEEAKTELRYLIQNFPDSEDIYVAARKELDALENPPKKGPCFVATACYGDYDHPDVRTFRRWRDRRLLTTWSGRAFVRAYYRIGPDLARRIELMPMTKRIVRSALERFARRLEAK